DGGELGDGRGAAAGDDEMGDRHAPRQVAEEGGDLGLDAEILVGLGHALLVFLAGLLDENEATSQGGIERRDRRANDVGHDPRAPWPPPKTRICSFPASGGNGILAASSTAGRTGLPVWTSLRR